MWLLCHRGRMNAYFHKQVEVPSTGGQFLFKQVRHGTGEDWAEKVCAELARRLELPHAEYDLAQWERDDGNLRGVRSRSFCPPGAALILGTELLARADPDYAVGAGSRYRVPAHTVERVMLNLNARAPALPLGWNRPPFVQMQQTRSSAIFFSIPKAAQILFQSGAALEAVASQSRPTFIE
jgi:hypothetical protein